ncbi:hypothetical protein [Rubellicoccus peritrichatus]|uniref:PEP-CTERM protein-sorting domain-containing protein n=1 Tax=Rubellicoccus peritrichatus TaxID=3080537 RepID=A0AAQ3L829_9BACT|nr:hypothetical protein [Puniceicoccus sp. CR14]WOO41384.1 hypothetical protein RZN69_22420 [Puniceicoccus sp. CR14]
MIKGMSLTALLVIAATVQSHGFLNVNLSGNTQYEGWESLTTANNPGYGTFPGASPWPAPIASNSTGSAGNASYNKVSGNGYPAGSSVYSPFTTTTYEVTSSSVISGIQTAVFQLDMGAGEGGILDSAPVFNYNGGSQALAADFTAVTAGNFSFTNPIDPTQTGNTTNLVYEWDLSSIVDSITSYEITWQTHAHSQTYGIQLDTGDNFTVSAVPEPSVYAAGAGILALGVAWLRRKKISQQSA